MSVRLDVSEMIGAFGATYRTIDLRCAAVKRAGTWENVYTVIRLRYEEPNFVQTRQRELEAQHGAVHTESFQVLLDQRPFSDWNRIRGGFSIHRLMIGGVEVVFRQPIENELSRTLAYLQEGDSEIRPFDSYTWPAAQFHVSPYSVPPLRDDTLARETTKVGYPDPYDAVNLLCNLNIQSNQSQGCQLYISMPAFALVSGFRILPKDKSVRVEIKRHRELGSLKSWVLFRSRDHRRVEPWKHRLPIEPVISSDEEILTAVGSADLPEVEDDDWAEVQVLHPDVGEVCKKSNSVRQLIPVAQRNVLLETLKYFCPEAEFRSLVVRPFDKNGPRLKVSAGFEL